MGRSAEPNHGAQKQIRFVNCIRRVGVFFCVGPNCLNQRLHSQPGIQYAADKQDFGGLLAPFVDSKARIVASAGYFCTGASCLTTSAPL